MAKPPRDLLQNLAVKLAHQDVCTLILEVRGICLRQKFEASVEIGSRVFCRLEKNEKARLGECIAVHRSSDDELAGRVAAVHGDLLVPFLRHGHFFLYHW